MNETIANATASAIANATQAATQETKYTMNDVWIALVVILGATAVTAIAYFWKKRVV